MQPKGLFDSITPQIAENRTVANSLLLFLKYSAKCLFLKWLYQTVENLKYDSRKEKVISFAWQYVLLVVSLFVMTFGVALCVRSNLGCSVISTIPFVMSQAGESGLVAALTIGEYTYIMNGLLVLLQILILRKKFELVQSLQLVIGFVFGYFLDLNM